MDPLEGTEVYGKRAASVAAAAVAELVLVALLVEAFPVADASLLVIEDVAEFSAVAAGFGFTENRGLNLLFGAAGAASAASSLLNDRAASAAAVAPLSTDEFRGEFSL
jgi:hypothetical protein